MNTASPMDRPLPYNVDFEANVIASVMIDPAYAFERIPFLTPDHFYRDAHALLFATLLEMWRDGKDIDLMTLTDTLDRDDFLGKVGGPAYLSEMLVRLPTATHVKTYAEQVYIDGETRKGIGQAEKAVKTAYTGNIIDFQQALKTAADSVRPMVDCDALDNADLGRRLLTQIRETHDTGQAPLLPMSIALLAEYMNGWERKRITVLGSLSSVGKSSFAIQEAEFLAGKGYHVVDVSIEIDAVARASRYISLIGAIDETQLIRGFLPHDVPRSGISAKYPHRRWSREQVEGDTLTAAERFAQLPISIVARDLDTRFEPDFTLDGIINHIRRIHARRPVDFIILDHLRIVKWQRNQDGFKQGIEYGEAVFRLLELAETLNAHALVLNQLDEKALGVKVPDSSHFLGSQNVYHNTNNMIALYSPAIHDKSITDHTRRDCNLIKVRRGQTGIVQGLHFDGAISRFSVGSSEPPYQNGTSRLAERLTPTAIDEIEW